MLISKMYSTTKMVNFQLISLWNVVNKLAMKVITDQLKSILPHIISNIQSVFMPRRLIYDNILISCEIFHSMMSQRIRMG